MRRYPQVVIILWLLFILWMVPTPSYAAPLPQEGDEATLRVINESEETICYVLICPPGAENLREDCPLFAETTITPGDTHDFAVATGNYAVGLGDCEGNFLFNKGGFAITDEYELRFTGATDAQSTSDCDALLQQGIDLYQHSQFREALTQWKAALTCYSETGNRQGEGNALHNLGVAYYFLGQYQTAIDHHEQALAITREIGNRLGQVSCLDSLGNAHCSLGQYHTAIGYHEQALVLAQEIDDRLGEGAASGNLGKAYFSLGQSQTGIDYFEQALAIAQEIGDRRSEGVFLGNLGSAYYFLGQYHTAIGYHHQALAIAQEIGNSMSVGYHQCNLGVVYFSLGQYQTAIDYYEQALTLAREIDNRQNEVACLGNLGIAYFSLGQSRTGIGYFEQALAVAQEIGNRRDEGTHLGNLGIAYHSLGQYEKAIRCYEQALSIAQEIGDHRGEGNHLGSFGNTYRNLAQYETAIDYYEQALAIAREIGDRAMEGAALGNLGFVYYSSGQYDQALAHYQQSIAVRETLREEIRVEEWKSSFTAENMRPYRGIIKVLLKLNRPADAFHYAQRAKARTFLDQIGNVRVDPRATDDPKLIEQEQALLADIRGLEAVLSGRQDFASVGDTRGGGAGTLTTEQETEIQTRLEAAYREYEHLLAQIKRTNPAYADLRAVQASTLITVQQTLPANTTLVEYYVLSDIQTLAFVVTPDAFHTVPLSVSVEALDQTINWFRGFPTLAGVPESVQTLYTWLFAPLREYIKTDAVLIAPHQRLHYLPFEALHDGERYLVEDYVIGYLPSASLLRYLRAPQSSSGESGGALVLGNPDNPAVSPLSGAEAEAQAVAELFGVPAHLNAEATESLLWEQAAGARYVHVAAHGAFNATAPQFSRLYLAPLDVRSQATTNTLTSRINSGSSPHTDDNLSTHNDGLLETREVWNLPLENADLVTLSACQTQLGELSSGDELVGLSRAFIYAGTPSLVASLWSVEDASTEYLMTRFYGYLQEGQPKGAALRQAKLDTMETYPNPYYWAAFTLIGDLGTVPPMPSSRRWLWIGAGALLVVLVGAWLWRRR